MEKLILIYVEKYAIVQQKRLNCSGIIAKNYEDTVLKHIAPAAAGVLLY
ncbi:hypothetical protein [Clostridium sp. ZS2-4]|nr:hypothetical protein [Clostridium sp. ZS2-4]MCY6354361.1 hypothetical protein [Clostridium sp. ZS2-4]